MSDTCRTTRIPICSRISTRIVVSFGAHRLERGPFYETEVGLQLGCASPERMNWLSDVIISPNDREHVVLRAKLR
jgi:hypothetical protein